MMYDWMLHQGFAPIIIATKADKLKKSQIAAHVRAIEQGLDVEEDTIIIPFSAETKQGRGEIWELIDSLILPEKECGSQESDVSKEDASANAAGNGSEGCAAAGDSKNDNTKKSSGAGTSATGNGQADAPARKPRWKSTGRPVAKKTLKKAKAKAKKRK